MKLLLTILCLLILVSCSDQDSWTEEESKWTIEDGKNHVKEMILELQTHLSTSKYFNFNSDEDLLPLKDFIKNNDTKNPYVILTIFGRRSSVQMMKTNIVW